MPFWSKGNKEEAPAARDFTSSDEAAFDSGSSLSLPSSSIGGSNNAGAAAAAEMQQYIGAIQEQMIIQETITDISDKAFEKCVTKPNESLSGKEAACMQAVTLKWLDTNQFMMKRMQKKMSSGQNQNQAAF